MSYCVNPACPQPDNPNHAHLCQACGEQLLLRDRYRVVQALGQGGFGATFVAIDESLPGQPTCVIKQLRPASTSPQVLEMARDLFQREAKTLGKIGDHPQVPRLLDYFETTEQFYLVQEYVNGSTLKQEVKRTGPFSEFGVKQFLLELLPVLQYLHKHQVIHRDIKPANIIRREVDRKLVLIDFGAVKDQVSQTAMLNASGETAFTSFAIGTPGYAPQEQMALRPVYASDIYAVGVTCLYLLTGKSPKHFGYDPSTCEMIWRPHVRVSDSFGRVLAKMLEVSVRDRYQSASEVLRALDVECHIDSLSEGMVTQSKGTLNQSKGTLNQAAEGTKLDMGSAVWVPPEIREAQAIRERKAKQAKANNSQGRAGRNSGGARQLSSATTLRTGIAGQGASGSGKLDANGVKLAYSKGKRDFGDTDLVGLNLSKSNLAGANFYDAKLDKVNLHGSNLIGANFGRASLTEANLREANLSQAYLVNANLASCDFRGADLSNASLSNANLGGANLCGANLTGARVTDQQLATARTNWLTIKPNGKRGLF